MLDRKKKIEEMVRVTKQRCRIDNMCGSCGWETCNDCLSEALYNADYRKASEVARNIFGNLRILGHIDFEGNVCIRKDSFEELEKIYTEETR